MSYKWTGHKTFNMDKEYSVDCKQQRTGYGFRHVVTLFKYQPYIGDPEDGYHQKISTGKGCYYNRTWERYTYQSAIQDAIRKANLPKDVEARLNEWVSEGKEPLKQEMAIFGMSAMTAMLGDVLCDTQEEKNVWKKRALTAELPLDFPEDFDALDEDEKTRRLDGAIEQMREIA
jgi:hypothetical protein